MRQLWNYDGNLRQWRSLLTSIFHNFHEFNASLSMFQLCLLFACKNGGSDGITLLFSHIDIFQCLRDQCQCIDTLVKYCMLISNLVSLKTSVHKWSSFYDKNFHLIMYDNKLKLRSSVILQHFRQKFRNVHSSINIWIYTYIRALIKTISISYRQTCLYMYIQTYVRRECRSSDTDLNSLTVKNNLQNYNWDHKVITFIYVLGILNEVHYSLGLTTFVIVHMYIAFASICISSK